MSVSAGISSSDEHKAGWQPVSEEDKRLVLGQMSKLLDDPLFVSSKRYPSFLRFVVEQTLAGNQDSLKERTLGVEVFQRTPDYDTSLDAVVRLSAGEVRKRIAQYYQSPQHQNELRIELIPGSYVPVFYRPAAKVPDLTVPPVPVKPVELAEPVKNPANRRKTYLGVGLCAVVVLFAALPLYRWFSQSSLRNSFVYKTWAPLLESNRSVLICLGETYTGGEDRNVAYPVRPDDDSLHEAMGDRRDFIPFPDAVAFGKLVAVLSAHSRPFNVQNDRFTVYSQLRNTPVLLVGAFNNRWTLNRIASLRFRLAGPDGAAKTLWIQDTEHPDKHDWQLNSLDPRSQVTNDYAIVARFKDSGTGQVVMVCAGLSGPGTMAGAEFLTDESALQQLAVNAPPGWEHKNFEAAIGAQVIDGMQGKPKVEAIAFW